jgi:hypothetical protein
MKWRFDAGGTPASKMTRQHRPSSNKIVMKVGKWRLFGEIIFNSIFYSFVCLSTIF